jgi:hypothetical protein
MGPARRSQPRFTKFLLLDEAFQCECQLAPESFALLLHPGAVLFTADIFCIREEFALPAFDGLPVTPSRDIALELEHVQLYPGFLDRDQIRAGLQGSAHYVSELEQDLPQRLARARLRSVAPEQRHQLLAAAMACRMPREIGEECQRFARTAQGVLRTLEPKLTECVKAERRSH